MFQLLNRRTPQLWLDKVCINQANILEDLECLPTFLAGCNRMLVTTGLTYTSRLWCVMELFVYISMRTEGEQAAPDIISLGATEQERGEVAQTWTSFDASRCKCFDPKDKDRILEVIETSAGGIAGFNASVMAIAAVQMPAPNTTKLDMGKSQTISAPVAHVTMSEIEVDIVII